MINDDSIAALAAAYEVAVPFPHVVIDGWFDGPQLSDAWNEFPDPTDPRWHTFDAPHEREKQQIDGHDAWALPKVARLLSEMIGPTFIDMLERVTGIPALRADITGGGMHQTMRGGYLGMHTDTSSDFNDLGLYRRLNVLLFMNAWQGGDGGPLVLSRGVESRAIAPTWNRLVIFATGPDTWHGHPDPWAGLQPRRSLAVYYYTVLPPGDYAGVRDTYFREDDDG